MAYNLYHHLGRLNAFFLVVRAEYYTKKTLYPLLRSRIKPERIETQSECNYL